MGFWSKTAAAPSLWMASGFATLEPRFLRPEAIPLPVPNAGDTIRRLADSDSHIVAIFWQKYYSGSDWELDDSVHVWAHRYLQDPDVFAFGLFNSSGLLATIVSTPLGPTMMSHGASLRSTRVIEGLCVHDVCRGKGVAGFMIEYIDAYTSKACGPVALFWSREMSAKPLFSTAISTDTYAYTRCELCPERLRVNPVEWSVFQGLWTSNTSSWPGKCIIATAPVSRRGALIVLEVQNHIVVVSRTGRRTKPDRIPIWEVVWCGLRVDNILVPGNCTEGVLTSVAAYLKTGLLFASSSPIGGGVARDWALWHYGRSGVHAWYIYNYVPPAFGSCLFHAIRDEI